LEATDPSLPALPDLQVGEAEAIKFHLHEQEHKQISCLDVSEKAMKDPYCVLREKEQDVERVRKEIQALHTVIPLLSDDQLSSDDLMPALLLSVSRESVDSPDKSIADLEPLVRHLRNSSAPSRSFRENRSPEGVLGQ
jgi:hypothetical protein